MAAPSEKYDRYPGLNAFSIEQSLIFCGRSNETNELYDLVLSEKVVTLYAQSGTGKSSLLNAGLIPRLRSNGFFPVKVRFKDWDQPDISPVSTFKYIFSPFFSTERLPYGKNEQDLRLWEYYKACRFPFDYFPVVIFDQFEEFFYFPAEKRERFAGELAELLHDNLPNYIFDQLHRESSSVKAAPLHAWFSQPAIKMIFSIRSDRLYELNELSQSMPWVQRARFELKPLTVAAAQECILKPAAKEGWYFSTLPFGYTPEAVAQIKEELSKGKGEVESSQLQIICDQIEKKIRAAQEERKMNEEQGDPEILLCDPLLYGGKAGLQAIIENYYKSRLETFSDPDQRNLVAHFFEDVLIRDEKRTILRESAAKTELDGDVGLLTKLLDIRLIREDYFKGDKIFELSHDSLIPAIVGEKKRREELRERERERARQKDADRTLAIANIEAFFGYLQSKETGKGEAALQVAIELYSRYPDLGSAKVKTMLHLARLYVSQKKFDKAASLIDKAEAEAVQEGNKRLQGQVCELRANLIELDIIDETTVDVYIKALELFRESQSYQDYARLSENIAVLLEAQTDADVNEKVIESGITFYEQALDNYYLVNDVPSVKRIQRSVKRMERLIRPFAYLTDLLTRSSYELIGNRTFFIGRTAGDMNNDISFTDSFVSRRHLIITPDLMINDLQSKNGTTLNAAPLHYGVAPTLKSGDIIVMGNSVPLLFTEPGSAKLPAKLPFWAVLIDGYNRSFMYLRKPHYVISPNAAGDQLSVAAGDNPGGLLEIYARDKDHFARFLGKGTSDEDLGPSWQLMIGIKDLNDPDRSYVYYTINPGVEFKVDSLSAASFFVRKNEKGNVERLFFQIVCNSQPARSTKKAKPS